MSDSDRQTVLTRGKGMTNNSIELYEDLVLYMTKLTWYCALAVVFVICHLSQVVYMSVIVCPAANSTALWGL